MLLLLFSTTSLLRSLCRGQGHFSDRFLCSHVALLKVLPSRFLPVLMLVQSRIMWSCWVQSKRMRRSVRTIGFVSAGCRTYSPLNILWDGLAFTAPVSTRSLSGSFPNHFSRSHEDGKSSVSPCLMLGYSIISESSTLSLASFLFAIQPFTCPIQTLSRKQPPTKLRDFRSLWGGTSRHNAVLLAPPCFGFSILPCPLPCRPGG